MELGLPGAGMAERDVDHEELAAIGSEEWNASASPAITAGASDKHASWHEATVMNYSSDQASSLQPLLRSIDRRQIDRCAYADVSSKNREWKLHQAPRWCARLASVG
jgi:hypothetical protein